MKSEVSKIINFEHLPEDARKELLDFYEYLLIQTWKSQDKQFPHIRGRNTFLNL